MIDVSLLKNHYLRGPLTKEQQDELFMALRNAGVRTRGYDLTLSDGNYAYFIIKSHFSEAEYLTLRVRDSDEWRNIPSYLKEIKFDEIYVPDGDLEFSWEAICNLLGGNRSGVEC